MRQKEAQNVNFEGFFSFDIPHKRDLEIPKLIIVRFTSPLDELQHLLELKDLYLQRFLDQFPPSSTLNETRLRGHT